MKQHLNENGRNKTSASTIGAEWPCMMTRYRQFYTAALQVHSTLDMRRGNGGNRSIVYPLFLILSGEKSRLVKLSTFIFLEKALLSHKGLRLQKQLILSSEIRLVKPLFELSQSK